MRRTTVAQPACPKIMLVLAMIFSFVSVALPFSPTVSTLSSRASVQPFVQCRNHASIQGQKSVQPSARRKHNSELNMVATAGVAAVTGALTGGVFAGGLHAVAGPDHLAALLPKCCGQRWYKAGRIGALWGLGHGVSATILGVSAFGLKSRLHNLSAMKWLMTGASSAMEIAVGASLVVIGLLGVKEAREWKQEIEDVSPQSLSAAAADTGVKMSRNRAVVFNGLLHGFSWDGAPSLAPAVAVATWRGNLTFLLAYAFGTMAAMAGTTTIIGEGTRKAGEILHRPDVPQKFSYVSSFLAMIVGGVWMALALR